jgi:hypothetical protein
MFVWQTHEFPGQSNENDDVRFVPKADSCTAATDSHIQRRTLAT